MQLVKILQWATPALLFAGVNAVPALDTGASAHVARQDGDQCCTFKGPPPRDYKAQLVKDYASYFMGNLEIAQTIISPNAVLKTDRHLYGNSSVPFNPTNRTQISEYVSLIRMGWDQADFVVTHWFEDQYSLTVRWTFNGTLGADFAYVKTDKPQGTLVTFNGMDILTLNQCTGLIDDAYVFQDQLDMIWQMGGKTIHI
ncbi:hypothetical protein HJFPF1_00009 [Paramyrothecium foliicola]|nr:hypothetical protein HJFPF1_00009 [Paramyrothecium foliicola]